MRPKDFWDSSMQEVVCAMNGFMEFNGGKNEKPLDHDELDDLMELYPDE